MLSLSSLAQAENATCSMRRMVCPVPEEHVDGNYVILGNETGGGECQSNRTANQTLFDFSVDGCNATVAVDDTSGSEFYTVTLVPYIAFGGLDFIEWPDIVCSCEVDFKGTVVAVAVEVVDNTEAESFVGRSGFSPFM